MCTAHGKGQRILAAATRLACGATRLACRATRLALGGRREGGTRLAGEGGEAADKKRPFLGQSLVGQSNFGSWCVGVMVGPSRWGPEVWVPEGWEAQNFAFFPSPATVIFPSSLSWRYSRGILVFEASVP